MAKSGRGARWGGYLAWPRVATAEGEGSSLAEDGGQVPEKLHESSDLKGECRLKKLRGKYRRRESSRRSTMAVQAGPSERVRGHRDIKH